jgi:hypothetical protein
MVENTLVSVANRMRIDGSNFSGEICKKMLFDESAKALNSDGLINFDDDWNLALLYELVETKFENEQQKVAER